MPRRKNERVEEGFEKKPHDPAIQEGEFLGETEDVPTSVGPGIVPVRGPNLGAPSELASPNMSPEEQDMEMTAQVVGPPAYGSPDPATSAGRLLPVGDHPLSHLPEGHPALISEDYGGDLGETVTLPPPNEGGLVSQPLAPTDLEAALQGRGGGSYEDMSKEELMNLAQSRDISGRSEMNKAELVEAHTAYDAEAAVGTSEE